MAPVLKSITLLVPGPPLITLCLQRLLLSYSVTTGVITSSRLTPTVLFLSSIHYASLLICVRLTNTIFVCRLSWENKSLFYYDSFFLETLVRRCIQTYTWFPHFVQHLLFTFENKYWVSRYSQIIINNSRVKNKLMYKIQHYATKVEN